MKLRTKMVVAFAAVLILPMVIFIASVWGLTTLQTRAIEKTYGVDDADGVLGGNTIQIFDQLTRSAYYTVSAQARDGADRFLEPAQVKRLDTELDRFHSNLVVEKEGNFFYPAEGVDDAEKALLKSVPAELSQQHPNVTTFLSDMKSLVSAVPLSFSDGTAGTAYIVTPVSQLLPEIRNMTLEIIVLLVVLLLLMVAMIVFWLTRSILNPISELKKATQEIKEGNLNYQLKIETDDEIGQLGSDFEEMRIRLRDSAEEKVRYDRESKELLSNISHDLRTPVTAIKGYAEGIMEGVASSPDKLDKYIRTIYTKAVDMERLIEELTFYSKIDTNRIPYNFTKIDISDYFRDCVEEVGMELETYGIELRYYNALIEPVIVIADSEQLRRVIHNIVSNSIKYLDKKRGLIQIRVLDAGDFVQVEIEDNGQGIAARDLPNIFDRFYRTDASRNSSKGGSGIGLSIVRKIIEDHGGRIWATSREGFGTTMHFVLRKYQEVTYEQDPDH